MVSSNFQILYFLTSKVFSSFGSHQSNFTILSCLGFFITRKYRKSSHFSFQFITWSLPSLNCLINVLSCLLTWFGWRFKKLILILSCWVSHFSNLTSQFHFSSNFPRDLQFRRLSNHKAIFIQVDGPFYLQQNEHFFPFLADLNLLQPHSIEFRNLNSSR